MLSANMEKALNRQLNAEFSSAYFYLSAAAYLESTDLGGMANWMKIQAQEEAAHAMKFYQYIVDRNGRVTLHAIEQPASEWASPEAVFQDVLEHEQSVSAKINALVALALDENDHSTNNFLQWFVAEQVEEEATAHDVLSQVRRFGGSGQGLFLIDRELGTRKLSSRQGTAEGA